MSKYSESAFNTVLAYLWHELKNEQVMNPADYRIDKYNLDFIPILPVQDEPQAANQLDHLPYIVYDIATYPVKPGDDWWRRADEITLKIHCPDENKIYEIGNFLQDKFHKMDESAQAIQRFAGPLNVFTFHCTELISFEVYRPASSEDGRKIGDCIISYEYTRDQPISPIYLYVSDGGHTSVASGP